MTRRSGGWSEESLHHWLARTLAPRGLRGGFGNDAAVLARALAAPVICTDQTIEGVHYARGTSGARVGRKAADRSLSDLAATAAEPRALVLSMALSSRASEAWVRAAILAVQRRARSFGAELVGGDLARTDGPTVIAVAALGDFAARRAPPSRAHARAGQMVVLTGPVGGSAAGRHLAFEPRVAEGRWLSRLGATAMMDVSDGLARDLGRIARASAVRIDVERVPLTAAARRASRRSGRSALDHGLYDGEDYELIATLAPRAAARAVREAPRECPALAVIGRVRAGRGVFVPDEEGSADLRPFDPARGWNHGS